MGAPDLLAMVYADGLTVLAQGGQLDAVRKAADLLADYGCLAREAVPTGTTGGRPSDRYLIHPMLLNGAHDGRALCLECRYLTDTIATTWRCGSHKSASAPRNLPGDLVTRLQRCPAFSNGGA